MPRLGAAMGNAAEARAQEAARRLALGFALLVALTSGLIVLGALVRAHGAGLACPDWPLCFGRLLPEMNFEVAFEFGHRAMAGGVSLIFAALLMRAWRLRPLRPLLSLAAALLALQIVLGALTVWQLLAAWTVTSHLLTGNAFNAICLWLMLRLREFGAPSSALQSNAAAESQTDAADNARRASAATAWVSLRGWVIGAGILLLLQVALGGLVSSNYAGLACPEWPACRGGEWFPTFYGGVGLHLLHRLNGYALCAALAATALCARQTRLAKLAQLALALGLAQLAVGVANVLLEIPVEVTALHSALAAALVLAQFALLREALRAQASRGEEWRSSSRAR